MKSLISKLIMIILSLGTAHAQNNLVLNGSFEQVNGCALGVSVIDANYLYFVSNPNGYSPDYFNACYTPMGFPYYSKGTPSNTRGYQIAKTGNAYIGLDLWEKNDPAHEYVQLRLKDSLKINHRYAFECFLSRAERFRYATADFGVYFSNDSVSMPTTAILPFMPQIDNPAGNYLTDTTKWIPFRGTYLALGGEKYVILGNFNDGNDGVDTLYQYFILNTSNGYFQGPNCANWAYYYLDDVSLIDLDSALTIEENESKRNDIEILPNPAAEIIKLTNIEPNTLITITTLTGSIKLKTSINPNQELNISHLTNGLYFIQARTKNKLKTVKFIKF